MAADQILQMRAALDAALENDRVRRRFGLAARQYRAIVRRLARVEADPWDLGEVHVRALIGESRCRSELGADLAACEQLLDEARGWAERTGDPALVALVRGRRGLLALRRGAFGPALADLRAAEEGLPPGPDLGAVYLNRGSLFLERGRLDEAVHDLARCVSVTSGGVEPALEAMANHNLGYALYLRGDLPAALRAMDLAAATAPPEHAGVGLMDKAAVLYEAGLLTEAESALRDAVAVLAENHASRDLVDARLGQARCLVGLDRLDGALTLARRVRASARRAGNELLALRAGLVVVDARHSALLRSGAPAAAYRTVARDADALAERARGVQGAGRLAVDVRLVAAEALVRGGAVDGAAEHLRRLPPRSGLSLGTQVRAELVRALCAFADEDRRGGVAAIRRGQGLLARQRRRLGAVEAVTAAAAHGVRLQAVDIEAALRSGRAEALFDAVERGRATFAGSGRVRPPADPGVAALVAAARRLADRARQLDGAPDAALEQADLRREARRLQDRARQMSWHADGDGGGVPEPASARALRDELRAAGSDRVVLDLAAVQGRVRGVRVDRRGARLFDLAPVDLVLERARRVRADLEVLANPRLPTLLHESALRSLGRGLTWLDDVLVRASGVEGPAFVAARDRLVSLPWTSFPSRRGLSTVVNSWVGRNIAGWRAGPGLVVGGPGVSGAVEETEAVAGVWGASTRVVHGAAATCEAVTAALEGAPVVHVAAHGTHEPENPVFSSLRLADGPLFAHELDGRDLTSSVFVLSACDVGSVSVRYGGEPLGLTSVLLRMGARAVVASVAPLRDDVAVRVMPVLHAGMRAGLRPGEALARAVADEPEPVPLVCFGPLVL